jgi:hypothetical protein
MAIKCRKMETDFSLRNVVTVVAQPAVPVSKSYDSVLSPTPGSPRRSFRPGRPTAPVGGSGSDGRYGTDDSGAYRDRGCGAGRRRKQRAGSPAPSGVVGRTFSDRYTHCGGTTDASGAHCPAFRAGEPCVKRPRPRDYGSICESSAQDSPARARG